MIEKNKKKVLFFLPSEIGGAEKMTINIAKMLDLNFYDVEFVFVDKNIRDIVKFIPEAYKFSLLKIRNIWDFTVCKMIRFMNQKKPDVVFCSLKYMNPRVILAAKIVGNIRIVIRNDAYMNLIKGITMRLIKYTYPKADVIIAQTDQMRNEILRTLNISQEKVVTLHNPVDVELIEQKLSVANNPYKVSGLKYVATSRINYHKAQDTLIKAFAKVLETYPDSNLFILGPYKEQDSFFIELHNIIKKFGIKEKVHFIGFTDNPYQWLKYADCFVLASRREGLPNSLIEASYIGVPAVAANCLEIINEIVKDDYNGYVVPVDDEEAMANAMVKAVKLHHFDMIYKQATKEQFVALFETK